MDLSDEYKEMCAGTGDYLSSRWLKSAGDYCFKGNETQLLGTNPPDEQSYWLPRVDQLLYIWEQESPSKSAWGMLRYIYMRTATDEKGLNAYYLYFDTLEQILLALLMREVKGMRWDWDSHEWRKESEMLRPEFN